MANNTQLSFWICFLFLYFLHFFRVSACEAAHEQTVDWTKETKNNALMAFVGLFVFFIQFLVSALVAITHQTISFLSSTIPPFICVRLFLCMDMDNNNINEKKNRWPIEYIRTNNCDGNNPTIDGLHLECCEINHESNRTYSHIHIAHSQMIIYCLLLRTLHILITAMALHVCLFSHTKSTDATPTAQMK